MRKFLSNLLLILVPIFGFSQILHEGFDNINTLESSGWTMTNQSSEVGLTDWFQGNPDVFPALTGDGTSYIGANFNNTGGAGDISNWLITPTVEVKDGDKLTFWTRTAEGSIWNDRLEVRSSSGAMTLPVGSDDVGSFSEVLLIINDDYNLSYPENWTKYVIEISGVGDTPTDMNFAFRYNVLSGGPSGNDSNFIGIDEVTISDEDVVDPPNPCNFNITVTVEPITRVILGDIDNSSSATSFDPLEDFTDIIGHLGAGIDYEIAVEGYTGGNFTNYVTVFLDISENEDWSDYYMQEIGSLTNSSGTDGQQAVGTVNFPTDLPAGTYKMRVIKNYAVSPTNPCAPYSYGQAEDYTIELTPAEDCSGTPDSGTVSGPDMVCPNVTFSLSSEGATSGFFGISYQWQSAPAGSEEWTDIPGATSTNYTEINGISEPTDYRFTVNCSISGEVAVSNEISVDVNTNIEECYCIPQGTDSSRYINDFAAEGNDGENIDNMASGFSPGGYGDFTHMQVTADPGENVDFSANLVGGTFGFRIWVDWNNDGNFDPATESVWNSGSYSADHAGSFEIPEDAAGLYRMRIVGHWLSSIGDVDPCITGFTYGEFEDYTLNVAILDPCEGAPEAGTASGPDMVCPSTSFTLASTGATHGVGGIVRQWQSAPAGSEEWTDIEGQNSDNYYVSGGIETPTDFRYVVTCTFSGESDITNVVSIDINTIAEECYCIPVGTDPSFYINSFTATGDGIEDIDNQNSGFSPDGYGNFTDMAVSADAQSGINFTAQVSGGTSGFRIWVDWNRDGFFDPETEVVFFSSGYQSDHQGFFEAPLNASGAYRMRIANHWLNSEGDIDPCSDSHSYGEFEDYTINMAVLDDCSGAPEAGTADGPDIMCPNTSFDLTSVGATTGFVGLSYQWQSSPSGANDWSDIEGANGINYTVAEGIDEPTEFRFVVTCIASGEESISNTVSIDINEDTESCYCIPVGTDSSYFINSFNATGNGGIDIENMNSGFSPGGYGDFTDMIVTADPESGLNFNVAINGGTAGFRIWVDWNKDGNFNPETEVVWASTGYDSGHIGSFAIPQDADGPYRMRIVSHWLNSAGDIDPCADDHTYGEFEDYTIQVAPLEDCSGTPDAGIAEGPGEKCPNVSFQIKSTGATVGFAGMTYQWESTPAGDNNWESIPGATSLAYTVAGGITEATSYRFIVTCTLSGQTAISNTITVTVNNNEDECYCIPEGTTPSRYINDFTASGNGAMEIENTNSGFSPGGYGDFSEMVVTADAGGAVEFTTTFQGGTFGSRIWVDWNKDGHFDPVTEVAWSSSGYLETQSGSFNTPEDATGSYRFRVVAHWLSTTGDVDPCETGFTYGEFEDYTLSIGTGADCSQNFTGADLLGLPLNSPAMAANDFIVEENVEFELSTVTFEVASPNGSPQTFDIAFYDDDNGKPGNQIGDALTGVTPSETISSGIFEGTTFPKWLVKVELTETIAFIGTEPELTRYWVVINAPEDSSNIMVWVAHIHDESVSAYPAMTSTNGTTWTPASDGTNNADGNMKLDGQCETLVIGNNLNSFNFTYYPNPVKDILYINSNKNIENVQVFNLAGQQVMNKKQLNGQLDVTSLPSGVYLFRTILEGGQVETFKIIKK